MDQDNRAGTNCRQKEVHITPVTDRLDQLGISQSSNFNAAFAI